MQQKRLLEAALFLATRPLGLDELAKITGVHSLGFLKQLLDELQKDYADRAFEVIQTPDGWLLQVRQDLLPSVSHLSPNADLSEGCRRTLALVTIKEPVKQSEIVKSQGTKVYNYMKVLIDRGMIHAEPHGHTKILTLGKEFERYFGTDKERVKQQIRSQLALEDQQKLTSPQKQVREFAPAEQPPAAAKKPAAGQSAGSPEEPHGPERGGQIPHGPEPPDPSPNPDDDEDPDDDEEAVSLDLSMFAGRPVRNQPQDSSGQQQQEAPEPVQPRNALPQGSPSRASAASAAKRPKPQDPADALTTKIRVAPKAARPAGKPKPKTDDEPWDTDDV